MNPLHMSVAASRRLLFAIIKDSDCSSITYCNWALLVELPHRDVRIVVFAWVQNKTMGSASTSTLFLLAMVVHVMCVLASF